MPVNTISINDFFSRAKSTPVIDVRSPAEYTHAHFPGAFSIPLFNDEERAKVGTAYKQVSREEAIKIGLEFFGPKMRGIVEEVEKIDQGNGNSKTLLVYCWRGGMRSGAISWLLGLYGFDVYRLEGGYKTYRNYVLSLFENEYPLSLIGGYTGSGKTELLQSLSRHGEQIIDLEDLAKHKGSAFGNIGMPSQPGQEMFENLLAQKLKQAIENLEPGSRIWLEDESQRIGHVNIPNAFWASMRKAPVSFIDIPFESRLDHLVQEYGTLDKQRMIEAVGRIRERLGGLEAKNTVDFLEKDDFQGAFRILLKYYDKWYLKGLHNRSGLDTLLSKISFENVGSVNARRLLPETAIHENPETDPRPYSAMRT